jgi:hypothetical protein
MTSSSESGIAEALSSSVRTNSEKDDQLGERNKELHSKNEDIPILPVLACGMVLKNGRSECTSFLIITTFLENELQHAINRRM